MELIGIDGVTALLLVGCVAGAVEFVKALFDKNIRAAVIVFTAGLIGGLLSLALPFDAITGVVGGLAASGAITVGQNLGKAA